MTDTAHISMPRAAPLIMRAQDLAVAPPAHCPQVPEPQPLFWRAGVFLPAFAGTLLLVYGIYGWLIAGGMTGLEWALLTLIGATFVWVTVSVSTVGAAIAGLLRPRITRPQIAPSNRPLDVALLVPVYNEVPWDVFGNAAAMLNDLASCKGAHSYTLFILSDTRDDVIAGQEWQAFESLAAHATFPVHYRRRPMNTDKKVGNILDWVTGWGAAFEAMVVLDADSLMTGRAIERLADELGADPDAGLIQTFPMLIGAETLFARLQQFSNVAYGWLLAEGLALWSKSEGNYWGHNAIIRTRAFAQSAGLPGLPGRHRDNRLILSHDFVEAGLLRRAGWRVRFLPRVTGSFEETPGTLIDYAIRDQRWCRGNLQHLRLLRTAGLHPVSRFHLFHGAVSYLLSPAWFALLVIWALLGKDSDTNVIRYFNEANPLFPDWPPAMSHIDSAVFLAIMYAALLAPKLAGAAIIAASPPATRAFGGRAAFMGAVGTEILLSVAYAPIMMIQQTKAVIRALCTRAAPWSPQRRDAQRYGLATLAKFHWLETFLGVVLSAGLLMGLVSLWLLPIAVSLLLAVPLSALSALNIAQKAPRHLALNSPYTLREPAIVRRARIERALMKAQVDLSVPAE
ncbi:MAG: glucans biosynthesis glucosyltransferase MdoH [Pseudomonadota bacterium]